MVVVYSAAEDKAPYEAKARADKKRYSEEIIEYKNPQTMKAADTTAAADTSANA